MVWAAVWGLEVSAFSLILWNQMTSVLFPKNQKENKTENELLSASVAEQK